MTAASLPAYTLFAGIDIAATSFTVVLASSRTQFGSPCTLPQTPAGFTTLQERLQAQGSQPAQTLVVLEATGSYWMRLATELYAAGFVVSVINPAQAHHFAQAVLRRAKTDALDAHTLALFAAILQPAPWTPPPPVAEELQQRLSQRAALLQVRQQTRNQLHALRQRPTTIPSVTARAEALIAFCEAQLKELDREIATALQQDTAWAAAAARLQRIPGLGFVTIAWLLAGTHNFARCATPEQASAFVGLAPQPRQSGTSLHGASRLGQTGEPHLRTALYLATLSAARYNPVIKPFYERLRAAGKPTKVARCAAARKLLHLAWAVVTKEQDFDPAYVARRE